MEEQVNMNTGKLDEYMEGLRGMKTAAMNDLTAAKETIVNILNMYSHINRASMQDTKKHLVSAMDEAYLVMRRAFDFIRANATKEDMEQFKQVDVCQKCTGGSALAGHFWVFEIDDKSNMVLYVPLFESLELHNGAYIGYKENDTYFI